MFDVISLKSTFAICSLLLTNLEIYFANEIPNCDYEDTVNLTNAFKFKNNSYLYENIAITPDLVALYDYKEIFNGKRIKVEPHERGCICKERNCIKFCCDPYNEFIDTKTRECSSAGMDVEINYNPFINVTFNNGSSFKTNVAEEFLVQQEMPCEERSIFFYNTMFDDSEFSIFENGTLYRHFNEMHFTKGDYCLSPYKRSNGSWNLEPIICKRKYQMPLLYRINIIALAISVPFISLTVFVYIFIPELFNFHGKCLISYLTSMALDCTLFSMVTLADNVFSNTVCSSLGYIGLYFGLAFYFWQNVISFDIWRKFRSTGPQNGDQRKRFLLYSIYAWGVPLCLTCDVMIKDNFAIIDENEDNCWVKTYGSLAQFYYFSFSFATNLLNTVFFVMTVCKIINIQRNIKRLTMNDGTHHNLRLNKNNVGLFFRISLITGISWLLDIFVYFGDGVIDVIVDFIDSMLGILIFICFVLKPNVLKLIKIRFQLMRQERTNLLMGQLQH